MNLLQVIRAIEAAAAAQPSVATIVRNDIFRLNPEPSVRYGVFAWLQGEHRTSLSSGLMTWSFTFFYADRLREDRANELEVQSVGIETLENVLRLLVEGGIVAGDYGFQTFNQRFSDECAGVYCSVTLEAPKDGPCPDVYEDIVNNVKII